MKYQRIYTNVWQDDKFGGLTHQAQRMFLYLLTSPHSNLIGLYVLKRGYAMDDLNLGADSFEKYMKELMQSGMVLYCFKTHVVFIKNFMQHNTLQNPNQYKAAAKAVGSLPQSVVIQEFLTVMQTVCPTLYQTVTQSVSKHLDEDKDKGDGVDIDELLPDKPEPKQQKEYLPPMGEFENVLLTKDEIGKLRDRFGDIVPTVIENISRYIQNTAKGAAYKDHYAALLNWCEKEQKDKPKKSKYDGVEL